VVHRRHWLNVGDSLRIIRSTGNFEALAGMFDGAVGAAASAAGRALPLELAIAGVLAVSDDRA
jgi:hypothetical protein